MTDLTPIEHAAGSILADWLAHAILKQAQHHDDHAAALMLRDYLPLSDRADVRAIAGTGISGLAVIRVLRQHYPHLCTRA